MLDNLKRFVRLYFTILYIVILLICAKIDLSALRRKEGDILACVRGGEDHVPCDDSTRQRVDDEPDRIQPDYDELPMLSDHDAATRSHQLTEPLSTRRFQPAKTAAACSHQETPVLRAQLQPHGGAQSAVRPSAPLASIPRPVSQASNSSLASSSMARHTSSLRSLFSRSSSRSIQSRPRAPHVAKPKTEIKGDASMQRSAGDGRVEHGADTSSNIARVGYARMRFTVPFRRKIQTKSDLQLEREALEKEHQGFGKWYEAYCERTWAEKQRKEAQGRLRKMRQQWAVRV